MTKARKMKKLTLPLAMSCLTSIALADVARDRNQEVVPYQGSSFNSIIHVLQDDGLVSNGPKQDQEIQVYRDHKLPQYAVSFSSLGGILSNFLSGASKRTLVDHADYYENGFSKFVHANGVCLSGEWEITDPSEYTGYFAQGRRGLVVARASVALAETTNKGDRGFGLAVKLFPTMNPDQVVETTNIFSVEELSGTNAKRFLDVSETNAPPLFPSLKLAGVLAKIVPAFKGADSSPTYRPIGAIGRIGDVTAEKSPLYIRFSPAEGTVKNDQMDFRQEILQAVGENHGGIVMNIDVSDTTADRKATSGWKHLGVLRLNQSYLTYSCDRRLHFNHPKDDKRTSKK